MSLKPPVQDRFADLCDSDLLPSGPGQRREHIYDRQPGTSCLEWPAQWPTCIVLRCRAMLLAACVHAVPGQACYVSCMCRPTLQARAQTTSKQQASCTDNLTAACLQAACSGS